MVCIVATIALGAAQPPSGERGLLLCFAFALVFLSVYCFAGILSCGGLLFWHCH
jgi:hypothetical protein